MAADDGQLSTLGRDLSRLGRDVEERVTQAIERFALTGYQDAYRLRVGDWRVIFRRESGVIVVDNVLHRREAYRD